MTTQKRKSGQVDSLGIHWRRWSLSSTSPVNIRAVILTTFPFQCTILLTRFFQINLLEWIFIFYWEMSLVFVSKGLIDNKQPWITLTISLVYYHRCNYYLWLRISATYSCMFASTDPSFFLSFSHFARIFLSDLFCCCCCCCFCFCLHCRRHICCTLYFLNFLPLIFFPSVYLVYSLSTHPSIFTHNTCCRLTHPHIEVTWRQSQYRTPTRNLA